MNQISVAFKIKSLDSAQEFTTTGTYQYGTVSFLDPSNGDRHEVHIKDKTVDYVKQGSVDLRFHFDTKRITKGIYTVYQHHFEFAVVTDIIILDDYDVKIKYKLLQADELVNEATMELHYEFLKEE